MYLSRPAENVEVQALAVDSDQVLGSVTTNGAGVFQISAGTPLPKRFRVAADTPEGVRVERFVEEGDVPHLWLNIVSHLMSLYMQSHPGADAAEAEAAIRRGLTIKNNEGLYGTSDGRNSPFSHQRFLQAVQDSGLSFDAFCDNLLQRFDNGETTDFGSSAPPFRSEVVRARDLGEVRGQVGEVAVATKFLHFLGEQIGEKIFDSSVEFGVGQITAATGWHIGTKAEFQEINEKLDVISEQIVELTARVNEGFLNGLVIEDQQAVNSIVVNLTTAQTQLSMLSTATEASYTADPDTFDRGPAVVPSATTALLSAYSTVVSSNALQIFSRVLTSSSSSQNLLTLAAQQASEELKASPPNPNFVNYQLRRESLTDELVSNFELYIGYCTQLALVISENATAKQLPQGLSVVGFNPPAGNINNGLAQINDISAILNDAQQLVPDNVGSTDVILIDAENGLMWYLLTTLGRYDVAQNYMIDLQINGWAIPAGQAAPSKVGSSVSKDLLDFTRPSDMAGWRVPEVKELQTLYKRVQALGGGDKNPSKTLTALKALGFTGLSEDSSENYKKYWFNGSAQRNNNGNEGFQSYDMSKDGFGFEAIGIFDPDADPSYTCVLVRSIGPDAKPFGDTGNQYHRSYGLNLTSVKIAEIPLEVTGADVKSLRLLGSGTGIPNSDLTDRTVWTLENVSPPGIAFLNYTQTASESTDSLGNSVPAGSSVAQLVFRGPGSATVRSTVSSPVASESGTDSVTYTSTTRPALQAISISPQNLAYQKVPSSDDFQQFYCTGHLATGETVDLTGVVTWTFVPPIADTVTNPPIFSKTIGGDLVFGDPTALSSLMTVQAAYSKGSDTNQLWSDGGKDFTDTSTFAIPK